MNINDYYSDYKGRLNSIIDSSLAEVDLANDVALCFNIVADYEMWLDCIGNRIENVIYNNAIKVFQDALGNMLSGKYQSAFMGLRYYMERTLCGVYLSANELELRTWLIGERDTYWTEVIGREGKETNVVSKEEDNAVNKGLFSTFYVRAFFPDIEDEVKHFRRIASSVYRECSEFVHGNPQALGMIPEHLEYKRELMELWCDKALIIKRVIFFVFAMRYLSELKVEEKNKIAELMKEEFATVKPIYNQF